MMEEAEGGKGSEESCGCLHDCFDGVARSACSTCSPID